VRARRRVDAGHVRGGIERRHARDAPLLHEGKALNRGNSDPQPGERAWTGCNREQIDIGEGQAMRLCQRDELVRQPFRLRTRAIARVLGDDVIVDEQGDAARPRRGVKRKHTHVKRRS
jgi:hypothetical protein